uniref:ABC transporter domain-containing protein n=1 Tax=Nelumbo nucifera TaxID=4432 RepID=A0A822ZIA6_NELNU|nr:TPA_asm: hypothetical protein HUJ06_002837 [Nelumbo nucifera]
MIVGPTKTLFMDEISTGLDSSTTFQIVRCLQQVVHLTEATILMSLLQPAPETFDLFDDVILLSEGQIVYHGPREHVVEFFESCDFRCPERKDIADFLQEVTSRKDQEQYWADKNKPFRYVSVTEFVNRFKRFHVGLRLDNELSVPYDKSRSHRAALVFDKYSVPKMELFKISMDREWLLLKRNSFVYVFKTVQIIMIALFGATVFFRTRLHTRNEDDGAVYIGALIFTLITNNFNGFTEIAMTITRLPQMASGLFRVIAGVCRTMTIANTGGDLTLLIVYMLGGFILPKNIIPKWWIWGYWVSPLSYTYNAFSVNEMYAPRWMNKLASDNSTRLGIQVLKNFQVFQKKNWFWFGCISLLGFTILFNVLFTLSLMYLNPIGKKQAIISEQAANEMEANREGTKEEPRIITTRSKRESISKSLSAADGNNSREMAIRLMSSKTNTNKGGRNADSLLEAASGVAPKRGMVLPFTPLAMSFDSISYYVDMPPEIKEQGVTEDRLQLLREVTGAFRPGALTALMGVSGAGKTTLMDVLAGRKTGGYIEGDIGISGFLKKQETFARISGYCEQNDIHSPQITIKESLLVELENLKDAIVGLPGITGLSTEQRKRLTIAVDLVANPSIIFMDEPTSGLDARAAAIVMRTVRNTDGSLIPSRTVVCTIHQPSIDIFEAFDELLLMKRGGQVIYAGPLGQHSHKIVEYFEAIPGVLRIKDKQNPAAWMLEASSIAAEVHLGIDFADYYKSSDLYQRDKSLVKELSTPPQGSKDIYFPTQYSQSMWGQFKSCLWKQCESSHDLTTIIGAMYVSVLFIGVNNCSTVQPVVAMERTVFYRERAAGMYYALPYAIAQVITELPYVFIQTTYYTLIVYAMISFQWTATKFFWFFFINFFSFLYFTYYGMMTVSITPNHEIASIFAAAFYGLFNLFSGFFIPKPKIPKWWIWYYWICPVAWTVYGLIISQYGDLEDQIRVPGGGTQSIKSYVTDHFGYDTGFIGPVAGILVGFTVFFAFMYAYAIKVLNFQQR